MTTNHERPATAAGRSFVIPFADLTPDDLPRVGGKGVNLGILTLHGFAVPPGFCVTTAAYDLWRAQATAGGLAALAALNDLDPQDTATVRRAGASVRAALDALPMPEPVAEAVAAAWEGLDAGGAYAVRSSATAEDLPDASFAGQQDTYLNIVGLAALRDAVRRCWVSLFTDRAIAYRAQNGFAHEAVKLSVVVQRMVDPRVSGILFTADPHSGHRHIASIDAGPGLGEALVAGVSSADLVRVDRRMHQVIERRAAAKTVAIRSVPGGGTAREELHGDEAAGLALTDHEAVALAELGGRIEALYGVPQDIEWSIDLSGHIAVLQARAITTLFPLPEPRPADGALHLYLSFGHIQVMTQAVPPATRSTWRTIFPFGKPDPVAENDSFAEAAGYLFIDLTSPLARRPLRAVIPRILPLVDRLVAQGVADFVQRPEFLARLPALATPTPLHSAFGFLGYLMSHAQHWMWRGDLDGALARIDALCDGWVAEAHARIAAAPPGPQRIHACREVAGGLLLPAFRGVMPAVVAGMLARALVGKLVPGKGDALNALLRGLDGNATTDMDLAVGDLADLARSDAVLAPLLAAGDLAALTAALAATSQEGDPDAHGVPPGAPFATRWRRFLDRYGDRGPAEIDISSVRWREDPSSLAAVILGTIRGAPGAHRRHHAALKAAGEEAANELVAAARHGLAGPLRARAVRRLTRVVRTLVPLREHPKFMIIRALAPVRAAIVAGGHDLAAAGMLDEPADVWFLRLAELEQALAGESDRAALRALVAARRAELARGARKVPPRLITSDGEILRLSYSQEVPAGALAGSPASAGIVEGIARVVLDPSTTTLHHGEVLVAPFTDPGWTPLFINAAALVMEVGGLMTHGSVVAREYGIPAVVGVLDATTKLATGQHVRVNGDLGYVEVLDDRGNDALPSEQVA